MRYVKFVDAEFFCEQVKCDIFFEIKRNISCDFFGESGNGNDDDAHELERLAGGTQNGAAER